MRLESFLPFGVIVWKESNKANESTHSSFSVGAGNRSTGHLSLRMDSGKIRLANRGGFGSVARYLSIATRCTYAQGSGKRS